MARGWESKAIEDQIDAAQERVEASRRPVLTPQQIEYQRQRESLELSRTRVIQDLAAAKNPKYRELLEQSLRFLDDKLSALESQAPSA